MSWHYRVLRHPDGWLALHEVHVDAAGQPAACSATPTTFGANAEEGVAGLAAALRLALADVEARPVLDLDGFATPKTSSEN